MCLSLTLGRVVRRFCRPPRELHVRVATFSPLQANAAQGREALSSPREARASRCDSSANLLSHQVHPGRAACALLRQKSPQVLSSLREKLLEWLFLARIVVKSELTCV